MTDKLKKLGFDNVGCIPAHSIPFEPSLIDLCKMNGCGNYGKNYTCPPLVGETDDLIQKAKQFKMAIVFQKVYPLEDSFDFDGMENGKKHFNTLIKNVRELCKKKLDCFLLLGAGGCDLCEKCGAVDGTPCPNPGDAIASLESYAIQVSTIAKLCNMEYINGKNTVTYFGAILTM